MTISKKLYASFGAAIVFTLVLGLAAWVSLVRIGDQIKVSASSTHKLALAGQLETLDQDILSLERGMVIRTFTKNLDKVDKYNDQFHADAEKRRAIVEEYLRVTTSDRARQILREMVTSSETRAEVHEELYRLAKSGDAVGAAALQVGKLKFVAEAQEAQEEEMKGIATAQVLDISAKNQAMVSASVWLVLVMIALSLAVGGVVVYIVQQINLALTATVVELSEGADHIASAASEVSSASQTLAQGASEQAASLEETSASSTEINSMAHKNTQNASEMKRLVGGSKAAFANTNSQLSEMMAAMDGINESSGKIAKIIKIIDEIAFQTNILALNAAVEAARAGEAGMGFAVVADEVRGLAQRSAQAAKDTAMLIEESVLKSEAGKVKLESVVGSIQQISGEFASLAVLVDEVSHGSSQQTTGLDQIGNTLSVMEQVTQTTAASAEESAAAAEELNAQSEALRELTGRLNAMVGASIESSTKVWRSSESANKRRATTAVKAPVRLVGKRPVVGAKTMAKPMARPGASAIPLEEFGFEDKFETF
jgi:methyl-accepting chemotaxis protein